MDIRQSQIYKFKKKAKNSKCVKYEVNQAGNVEYTEQKQFRPQTDGQTDGRMDGWTDGQHETTPFQLRWREGYKRIIS